jgi:5-methylcytosine-specific restriction endonuclease McrA
MKQKKPNKHDKCVMCGELTEYAEMDHINARRFYIDGRGHLCQVCFDDEHNYEPQKTK